MIPDRRPAPYHAAREQAGRHGRLPPGDQPPGRTARANLPTAETLTARIESELLPEMLAEYSAWDYCGDVASRVVAFLHRLGYKDA
jgi:hypothetical protein